MTPIRIRRSALSALLGAALALPLLASPAEAAVMPTGCHHQACGHHRDRDRERERHEEHGDNRSGERRDGEQQREQSQCHALLAVCGDDFHNILVEVGRALGGTPTPH